MDSADDNASENFQQFISSYKKYSWNLVTEILKSLPKDFIESDEYCVIEPGLTHFKQDEIINHADLLKYAEEYTLDTFTVIPHLSIQ